MPKTVGLVGEQYLIIEGEYKGDGEQNEKGVPTVVAVALMSELWDVADKGCCCSWTFFLKNPMWQGRVLNKTRQYGDVSGTAAPIFFVF